MLFATNTINYDKFNIFIKNFIIDMPNINKYNQVYVGIGAKFYKNNYPINLNTGINQLIPSFLNNNKILIIIIDKFNKYELDTNLNYIKYFIENNFNEDMPKNYDIIIINNFLNKIMAKKLLDYLSTKNKINNIIICNYVYYFNEILNKFEENNINNIQNLILYIVNYNNRQFKDNVFNWLATLKPKYICRFHFTIQIKIFLKTPNNLLNLQQKNFINSNIINFVE
jgi:hypothetical protein